ncbi:MAG TPA: PP2C family protein-serine/threonine phosphatase [Kofleriaceae bacterium]|jgi:serine phosphatase RsbU (regulator of sigma subunit)|nr:PP2C family protein-serine/threonine phosphatase [Kofleriaceae bacterium]
MNTPLRPAQATPFLAIAVLCAGGAIGVLAAAPQQRWVAVGLIGVALIAGLIAAIRLAGGGQAAHRAIALVVEQADRLQRGEPVSGGDPVAQPAIEALERVAGKVTQMMEARAHIVATERDLDRARRMYRSILPLASVAAHGRVRVAGQCEPAAETGGDWWTYRKLSGGRMLVVVGDATGHGVYSAMIGCAAHGAVEALYNVSEDVLTPTGVLTAINGAIKIPGGDQVAMTCFAALFDPMKGVVHFANASHMFPLVASTDDLGTIKSINALAGQNLPDDENAVDDSEIQPAGIRSGTQNLSPGDVVVLFTDGLIERRSKQNREFGHRRLQQAIQSAKLAPGDAGIAALRDAVMAKVDAWATGVAPDDDVTLVVCALERGR